MKNLFLLVLPAMVMTIISCGKEHSCENCLPLIDAAQNKPPVANTGTDSLLLVQSDSIVLDGSASYDPDGKITGYLWAHLSGPGFVILNAGSPKTVVKNLSEGIYLFELRVTDNGGLIGKDTVRFVVTKTVAGNCDNSNRSTVNARLIPMGTISGIISNVTIASVNNKLLFVGNTSTSSRVDIYDIITNEWSTAELSKPRGGMAVITAGSKVFFAGGGTEFKNAGFDEVYSDVDIYDASFNTWSATSLSEPRKFAAAATVGNKVLFAGGVSKNFECSGTVDMYDLITQKWSTAKLSEARGFITAVTANNKVYFAGGFNEYPGLAASGRIDIFDHANGSWVNSSLNALQGAVAGVSTGNHLYWANDCKIEITNFATGSTSYDFLFMPGKWLSGHSQNAVVKNDKIILLREGQNKFDIYNITTRQWSVGILPDVAYEYSIISVNSVVYVVYHKVQHTTTRQLSILEF